MNEDTIILLYIQNICSEKPHLLPKIIDAATKGVKEFAQKQKDFGSKLGFAMAAVLDSTTQENFGPFTRDDVLQMTKPWMDGTKWWEEHNKQSK